MKVLQIGKYFPPDVGGIETVTKILASGFHDAGIKSDVLCFSSSSKTIIENISGSKIIRVSTYGKIFSVPLSPALILWLRRICNEYDVIHLHLPNPMAEFAVYLIRPNAKLILHWHGDVDNRKFRFLTKLYSPLTGWIINRASRVIAATTAHIKFSYAYHLIKGKEEIIPYPYDTASSKASCSFVLNRGISIDNRFVILAVGRLIYYKGFNYLIEAAKYLDSNCLILIVGSGPLQHQLHSKIQSLSLQDRVILSGKLDDDELEYLFKKCDILCLPSIYRGEMFGMVQLEAMAHAKPIINTCIPYSGVHEVSIDGVTGITVPVENSLAIANAILELKSNGPLRTRMGLAGFERVRESYEKSVVISKIIELYKSVLVVKGFS